MQNTNLKRYQIEGINFLTRTTGELPYHSILGDDMGLGKTAQAICAASKMGAKKILVVCPSSVKINWMREFYKWSDYKNIFIVGSKGSTPAKNVRIDKDAEVIIVNYDLLSIPTINIQIKRMTFDVGIMDECHYLMSANSKRTKALITANGLIWRCKYKWCLSGTFLRNRNRDAYALLRSLFPHRLGIYKDYEMYAAYFCGGHMGAFGYNDSASTHTEELGKMIAPIMLRRTRTDVLKELPPVREANIFLDHDAGIKKVVDSEENFTVDEINAFRQFEQLGKTASYRKELAMAKETQVLGYIKEALNNNDKLVVFAYHRELIQNLSDELYNKYNVENVVLWGGLTDTEKQKRIDEFVNNPETKVFIGQIQAAGTGVDGLQKVCSSVIFAELDWTPANMDQAKGRIYRMGQKNKVYIQYLIVPNSLEESMLNAINNKRKNINNVMKQIETTVQEEKTERSICMTLEENIKRIADSLEKLVEIEAQKRLDYSLVGSSEPEPKPAKEEKPSSAKQKATKGIKIKSADKEVMEAVAEKLIATGEAKTKEIEEAVAKAEAMVPAISEEEAERLRSECKQYAEELRALVGPQLTTQYVNNITAEVTGNHNARLATCTGEQLLTVLEEIKRRVKDCKLAGDI